MTNSIAIHHLSTGRPEWFSMTATGRHSLEGHACVPDTPWVAAGLCLHIEGEDYVTVREAVPGTVFPRRCPERHIQQDQTFCLGLHKRPIATAADAAFWWAQLEIYIRCQSIAARTRVWPPNHALDHGAAGGYHEEALRLASELGLDEEYLGAYLDRPSWITDPDLHLVDRGGIALNGRAACPRGCMHRTRRRRSSPVIRRKCERRQKLLDLVRAEQGRRRELEAYWRSVIADGDTCCGTMRTCRLPQRQV